MADIDELKNYFKKLKKAIDTADLKLFGNKLVKKKRIDDLTCCIIALLPDSFKSAMKRKVSVELFPAVASYTRLSKIIQKTFFLSRDYYIFNETEAVTLIDNVVKYIETDINNLERT